VISRWLGSTFNIPICTLYSIDWERTNVKRKTVTSFTWNGTILPKTRNSNFGSYESLTMFGLSMNFIFFLHHSLSDEDLELLGLLSWQI